MGEFHRGNPWNYKMEQCENGVERRFSFYPIFAFPKIARKMIGSGMTKYQHTGPGAICQRPGGR
jgi:hypothetical protein